MVGGTARVAGRGWARGADERGRDSRDTYLGLDSRRDEAGQRAARAKGGSPARPVATDEVMPLVSVFWSFGFAAVEPP